MIRLAVSLVLLASAAPTIGEELSLDELDSRCEAAREAKLKPLREAEIARCKADRHNDPAFCERFYEDYGQGGGRNLRGVPIPRLFDDLPECEAAREARQE